MQARTLVLTRSIHEDTMLSQKTIKRHAGLVDRMASYVGIDLEEAALRGKITISQIDDAVLACTGCSRPCSCEAMLDRATGIVGAAPDFCRNAKVFEALKA
jgi:hypothetical protein